MIRGVGRVNDAAAVLAVEVNAWLGTQVSLVVGSEDHWQVRNESRLLGY